MIERIVIMQTEDGLVSLERQDGSIILYPQISIPPPFVEGDIVKSIVYSEDCILFLELDIEEMNLRRARMAEKKARLKLRARQGTEQA